MAKTRTISYVNNINEHTVTYDAASLAASLMREDAVTVPGIGANDIVVSWHGPAGAAMGFGQAWVTAADEITIQLINPTVGAVDLASGTFTFIVADMGG